jgi:hypothetical protein
MVSGIIRPSDERRAYLQQRVVVPTVSNFFPLERFYSAADKLYNLVNAMATQRDGQFLNVSNHTIECLRALPYEQMYKRQVYLDDCYTYGKRYCIYFTDVISSHICYNTEKYKALQNKHTAQLQLVISMLNRVADCMDQYALYRVQQERERLDEFRRNFEQQKNDSSSRRQIDGHETPQLPPNYQSLSALWNGVVPLPPPSAAAAAAGSTAAALPPSYDSVVNGSATSTSQHPFYGPMNGGSSDSVVVDQSALDKLQKLLPPKEPPSSSPPSAVVAGHLPNGRHATPQQKAMAFHKLYRNAAASLSPPSAGVAGHWPNGCHATPQQKAKAWHKHTYLEKDKNVSQPPATGGKATKSACSTFLAAKSFDGLRKGYVFKSGPEGLGYYAKTSRRMAARTLTGLITALAEEIKPVPNSAPPPAGGKDNSAPPPAMDVCTEYGPQVVEKAWKFVKSVLEMVDEMNKVEGNMVQAVASDSMFYVAMRTLSAQQAFHTAGKPTAVDLGYHYTQKENMATIRSDGLMSGTERATKGVSAVRNNGASYGHGVYTATNPCAWHGYYGDVGLIVARLQGDNVDFDRAGPNTGNRDSVTVERDNVRECVVLASSQQCIPILQFDSSQVSRNSHVHPGNMMVNRYHVALQALIDEMFNDMSRPAY